MTRSHWIILCRTLPIWVSFICIDVNVFTLQCPYQLGNYEKILKVLMMKYFNNNIFRLLLDIKVVQNQVIRL